MFRFSKSQIKGEMKQLYPAPAPQRKDRFLKEFPYPRTGWIETIVVQVSYIHKWVWVLSMLLVAAALVMGGNFRQGSSYDMLCCMSGVMPLLAVLAVTETFRSSVYGMAELEMASRHNLPQVLLIRMGAMGGVDFLLTVLGLPFIVRQGTMGIFRVAVHLMVPWLCTCVLALQIEKYAKGRETIWYCTACGLFLCGANTISGAIQEMVYDDGKFSFWVIAFCVFAVSLGRQIWQIWHETEEWKRNLYLAQ